ncbi:hypothetical protein ABKA04_009327 [Annulohypoxylon sp. FPYF3050]
MSPAENVTQMLLQEVQASLRYVLSLATGCWQLRAFGLLVVVFIAYQTGLGIYRLYLSPLSNIPGPKLAALSYLYESYYEILLGGQYFKRVAEMHEQYGPIVRVTPNEIHFNDPEFIDAVYPGFGRKTDKPIWFAQRTGTPFSIVSTPDHDLHRQRRNALNSFFSVASVRRLEPIMKEYMGKLISRMEQAGNTGEILQMHHLFKACASDVITVYAFGVCFGFMDTPDFGRAFFESTDWWIAQVRDIRNSPNPERVKSTIFEGILSSSLPPEEKTDERLASEAQLVVFAGEGTTAHTLTCCLYQLLANPMEVQRLKKELAGAIPNPDHILLSQVDSLPYLNAVIQEAVRLHPGVMARQVRISPEVPILYKDKQNGKQYVIPPKTVTSMSPLDIHMHPDAFGPDAYEYRPQRWIENPKLSRYFIGFSRGARNCVGMTLARREMAIILATVFLKWDVYNGKPGQGPTLELYDTERARDIDANGDFIIPVPARGSKGLRVKIRN